MNTLIPQSRGQQIQVPGMKYAPTSESAVVALFGIVAKHLGFAIERIGTRFPDCIATRRGKACRIEFELWASSFEAHGHKPTGADYVVCWENDWEGRPKKYRKLEVISLKRHVGALPRVFVVGCKPYNFSELGGARVEWNVPTKAQPGDLILIYRTLPEAAIHDAWRIIGPYNYYSRSNRQDRFPGMQAELRRVAKFEQPLTFDALKRDRRTRELPIVKKRFMGKTEITGYWPMFYKKIVELNPGVAPALRPFVESAVTEIGV